MRSCNRGLQLRIGEARAVQIGERVSGRNNVAVRERDCEFNRRRAVQSVMKAGSFKHMYKLAR